MTDPSNGTQLPVHWPPWARLVGLTCLALIPVAITKGNPRLVVIVGVLGTVLLVLGMSRHHDDRYMRTFPFALISGAPHDEGEDWPDWRMARAGAITLAYLTIASVGNSPPEIVAALSPALILGIWSNQVPRRAATWIPVVTIVSGVLGAVMLIASSGDSDAGLWRAASFGALIGATVAYTLVGLSIASIRSGLN